MGGGPALEGGGPGQAGPRVSQAAKRRAVWLGSLVAATGLSPSELRTLTLEEVQAIIKAKAKRRRR